MSRWNYLTSPTVEPVSFADMQAQLHIDSTAETALIQTYIIAARIYAETELQRTLIQRQIQLTKYDSEPPYAWVPLPRGPVVSIDLITDSQGNTVNASTYELRSMGALDFLYWHQITWPFTIKYTAGYGTTAASIPADIVQGIKLHTAHLWENRTATTTRPQTHIAMGLDAIYGQYCPRGIIG